MLFVMKCMVIPFSFSLPLFSFFPSPFCLCLSLLMARTHSTSFHTTRTHCSLPRSSGLISPPFISLSAFLTSLRHHLTQPKRTTVTHFHPFNSSSLLIVSHRSSSLSSSPLSPSEPGPFILDHGVCTFLVQWP